MAADDNNGEEVIAAFDKLKQTSDNLLHPFSPKWKTTTFEADAEVEASRGQCSLYCYRRVLAGQPRRTNPVEGWHYGLNLLTGKQHSILSHFLEKLQNEDAEITRNMQRLDGKIRNNYIHTDRTIERNVSRQPTLELPSFRDEENFAELPKSTRLLKSIALLQRQYPLLKVNPQYMSTSINYLKRNKHDEHGSINLFEILSDCVISNEYEVSGSELMSEYNFSSKQDYATGTLQEAVKPVV
ncbi:hypothetical protein C0J52_12281 [Blattella germanica]|nr:hypothetical protein C0J52_12281 [Blattella germanica]